MKNSTLLLLALGAVAVWYFSRPPSDRQAAATAYRNGWF